MKAFLTQRASRLVATAVACLFCWNAFSHIPHPVEVKGVILAVDQATRTMVFKYGTRKPTLLDWDGDTKFIENGRKSSPAAVTNGMPAKVSFRPVTFGNATLKTVIIGEEERRK